jgi:hypothetical protein
MIKQLMDVSASSTALECGEYNVRLVAGLKFSSLPDF